MTNAKILSPHDKLFKTAMSDLRVARDYFSHYLSKNILEKINLESLRLCKETYIDEDLQISMSDMLYSVDFKNDSRKKGYVYILAEHQSKPDKLMPFRILYYACKIIDQYLKGNNYQQNITLPIVYPMVFYNGKKAYPYTTDLFELFGENQVLAKEILLNPFKLIDLSTISDEEIKQHQWSGLMELFMKHIFARDILPHIKQASEIFRILCMPEKKAESYVYSVIKYVMNSAEIKNKQSFVKTFQQSLPDSLGEKTMPTFADMLRAEGKLEGEIKGEKTLLLRQLIRRFGVLPAENMKKIEHADAGTLLSWGDRILDAKTMDEVFG